MGNFWSAHWPQSHFRHHLLMCRHLPDGGKMTLTNFHFTHWDNAHVVEKIDLPDVPALYEALQTVLVLASMMPNMALLKVSWRRSWRRLIPILRRENRGDAVQTEGAVGRAGGPHLSHRQTRKVKGRI
jgi:hypothetical protein